MNENISTENTNAPKVSDAWKTKFDILHKIGADHKFLFKATGSAEYKGLSYREKIKISFNILAFLFGPVYYFSKKMWQKGAVILGASWLLAALLNLFESVAGFTIMAAFYWIPPAVICAQLANYDYFRRVLYGEKMWSGVPRFLGTPVGAIGFPLAALALFSWTLMLSPAFIEESKFQTLSDVSGVWLGDNEGEMLTISFTGNRKKLSIGEMQIPVTVKSVDLDNHIITIGVELGDGQQVYWALRQLFQKDGGFTIQLTLHNGDQEDYSFVRNL